MKIVICNSKKWFHFDDNVALRHKVLTCCDRDELTYDKLKQFDADLVFFPHWSWVVDSRIFRSFTCIVFHTAPLPYGRGGSPIQNLIKRGYKESPVYAIEMSAEIDGGGIYARDKISLNGKLSQIFRRLDKAVNRLIAELIDCLPQPQPQTGEIEVFDRLGHEENEISVDSKQADFYDAIRMLDDPSYPNAYIKLKNVVIELSDIDRNDDALICQARIVSRRLLE